MRTQPPLLAPIFRSEGQARLLAVVLLGDDELSLTDLADRASLAYPTTHREVARLISAGIFAERAVGRTRLVRANHESPLIDPIRQILLITTGPVVLLAKEFAEIPSIDSAFIYGSFAARSQGVEGPSPSDVDVMVIGSPEPDAVYAACDRVEQVVRRPVNATILSSAELGRDSGFLAQVASNPTLPILGEVSWPSSP